MKKYSRYKPSNIEWIGDIPEHWDVKVLKRLAKICNGQDHKKVWDANGQFPIIGTGGTFGYTDSYLHEGPSVVLGRKGTIDKPQYMETPFWSVDTAYYTNIFPSTNPRYFYHLCTTINFELYKYGSAVPSMSQEVLNQIPFAIPDNIKEQTAIANYLDKKTKEIDQLIDDKKQLLKLVEEEKKAIIYHAVTKGINPDSEMKDSYIEWIGKIPKHWELKKLKYVFNSLNNIRIPLSSEERGKMLERTYDYYGASGIIDKVESYLFDEPLLLIGEDGANLLTRSSRLVFIAKGKYWVNNHAHILKPKFGTLEYYSELLELFDFSLWVTGSAQPKLTSENLMNIQIIVPPVEEQELIMKFLEIEFAKVNSKMKKIKKLIKLLTEYRFALISEVVTGKVKVID